MELPKLGEQCSVKECKQLDFLPFTCTHCQLIFCKDHFPSDKHLCKNLPDREINLNAKSKTYPCSEIECSKTDATEMLCTVCNKHFCLKHRHHGCLDNAKERRKKTREQCLAIKKQFEDAKAEANREVEERLSRAKKKDGKCKTALKIQLMRLKGKAVGLKKIPMDNRAYFLIYPPVVSQRKSLAIFVSKEWSLGRCIDAFAEQLEVPNHNGHKMERQLRLFVRSDGQLVAGTMDTRLGDLVTSEQLIDGDSLVLEYVELPPPPVLPDVEPYKD